VKKVARDHIAAAISRSLSIAISSINPDLIATAQSRIIDEIVAMMKSELRAKRHVHVAVIATRNAIS